MSEEASTPKQLDWKQRILLAVLAGALRLWWRTLRFRWGADVQAVLDQPPRQSVVILWHNRLFPALEFFRRTFTERRLATLISASGDGAWLAAFMEKIGVRPIRGSRHKRGAQSVREMLSLHGEGYDIGVTPDGSRGPMYDFKPGAVAVALKTEAPFVMLSFTFGKAWRLKSWDQFFVPYPFSRIEVGLEVIEKPAELGEDAKAVAAKLQERMHSLTVD